MKLATKYHGEIEIEEKEIIRFEKGIPGFDEEQSFVILPFSDDSIFMILQSVTTPALAFVIADPFQFYKEYDFTLEDQTVEALELTSEKDVSIYVILTVQDPFQKTTANLQAPIVINNVKKLGKQVILTGTDYGTRHSIFQQMVK
ncbi:flagellar assembly protein FliW [Bacillus suaedaesalsae]|uniref:Flagellar assembly factor FliW n=1 Tax=Bacillus suaedaesalsae TaxID=2810349 RepID=A0ABS2DKK8_9BACI|nr:flagellar assembly protein FliW [Bacillus suaedaesalsae]MBM6619042.1 flagellar assembly protein FliW [Bacillus suaedaesalsae]